MTDIFDQVRDGDLSEFRPQETNANLHTPRGEGMLETAMHDVGFVAPITVAADGEAFDGSSRLEKVATVFKDVKPLVIEHDGTRPIVMKRIDIPTAKDPKAVKASVYANRVAEVSLEWDTDILEAWNDDGVLSIDEMWFPSEMEGWGEDSDPEISDEEDEENAADLLEKADAGDIEPRVKLGEIWALGRHRIACGDSCDEANVKALLGDRKVCLIHSDPPYGMGKEKDGVLNDNLYKEKLDNFQMQWWSASRSFLEENGSAYIWGNAEDLWRLWFSALGSSERMTIRNEIVWNKGNGQGQNSDQHRMYPTATERCLFFMLGEQSFNNNADNYWDGWEPIRVYLKTELAKVGDVKWAKRTAGHSETSGCHWFDSSQWTMPTEAVYNSWQKASNGQAFKREYDDLKREWMATRAYFDNTHQNMTDVWDFPRVTGEERWTHATPKPVAMVARCYASSSPQQGLIYSPFLGSGTDIIAAQKTEGDRTVYGFELSPEYCTVIIDRWEKYTGEVAELAGHL